MNEPKPYPDLTSEGLVWGMPDFNKQYRLHFEKLIQENVLAIEKLTREQFVEALVQATACGDFQRYIYQDKQNVVYLPYREYEIHKREIKRLEDLLLKHGISPKEYEET